MQPLPRIPRHDTVQVFRAYFALFINAKRTFKTLYWWLRNLGLPEQSHRLGSTKLCISKLLFISFILILECYLYM